MIFGKRNIPHFRGVFMRDNLPKAPARVECAVVNLDSKYGSGTHWVAYFKNGSSVKYFDSFGNLKPPLELMQYFNRNRNSKQVLRVMYNYDRYQNYNDINCGHLCLKFLLENVK